ncbi:hypothetical protein GCM10022419_099480 [Nonomuraea rosea]|uniref:Tetracyclin repressor-like C-terminal domain-containing protein n=1 Tax=Nonomuraea rosea TaxID=638574 RepID=A0ABP6Z8K3_9ACTN
MHQAVFALVKRGQQEGLLRSDLPPELLPQAITGTLHVVTRFARTLHTDPAAIGPQVADLLLLRQSRLPAQTPHQGRQPEEEGWQGRPAGQPRRRRLQGPQHRRASDQQAEGLAGHRHPLRQDP